MGRQKLLNKGENDNPSIGLILCRGRNRVVAEYSLRDMSKPIGVSDYKLTQEIPEEFKKALPDAEAWEKHLSIPFDAAADDGPNLQITSANLEANGQNVEDSAENPAQSGTATLSDQEQKIL